MSQGGVSSSGGGGGTLSTLTGNSGGAVSPTAGNINVVGTGTISVAGNPGTSTLTISSSVTPEVLTYTNVNTSPYVVLSGDQYISVDCSAGVIQINLPNTTTTGRVLEIKDRTGSSSTNNITVTTVGGAVLIDGAATYVMNTAYESVNVIFNAVGYEIF